MSKINRHPVRRTAAGVLAGALALSGAVTAATPAFAAPTFALERVQGNDRYETSAAIAAAFGNATNIILASGESGRTPDALAANFLAGVRNAPVLLTRRDTTPEPILTRLNALRAAGATRITVVGGPVAVADAQLVALRALGFTVDRVAGANRYETAAAVAVEGEEGEAQAASNIGIIASGVSTIDALAGGPLSYKGRHPLFLVTRDDAPGATVAALRATGVTSVFILGGEAVVGPRVVAELAAAGITVRERLAGANRSETSVAIANRLIADFGFSANTFNLASGVNEGIDALGGAALSGKENRVLLITNTATSAAPVTGFATTRTTTLTQGGRIFGGIAAVANTLETAVETAAGATGNNQSITVTPTEAVTLTVAASETGTNATADDRVYTATGLNASSTYRITLVNAANITRNANGTVTFVADGNTGLAAAGTVAADVTVVNGIPTATPTNQQSVGGITPVNGNIVFRVDGEVNETIVPVVYVDAGASTRLEIGSTGLPTEAFGLGGAINYNPPAATTGAVTPDAAITEQDETGNTIVTATGVYTYDDNDTFYIDANNNNAVDFGEQVTSTEFEAQLSVGDELSVGTLYNATAGLSSTFVIRDLTPTAPTLGAVTATDTTATITVTGVSTGATVRVYGAVDSDGAGAGVNPTVTTSSPLLGSTSTDQSATVPGFQVVISGLAVSTNYDVAATQTVGGEESTLSGEVEVTTTAVADPTLITDARLVTDAPIVGAVGTGDTFRLTFDANVDAANVAAGFIDVTDADGDLIRIDCDAVAGTTTDFLTSADCTLADGPDADSTVGDVLEVELTSAAEDRNAGGNAGSTGGGVSFPLTITAVSGFQTTAGDTVNITNSTDLSVDTES